MHLNPLFHHDLSGVFAPEIVAVPPACAIRGLMQLTDGEIRHYGFRLTGPHHTPEHIYISSQDEGRSWAQKLAAPVSPGATVRSPWSGDYLTVLNHTGTAPHVEHKTIDTQCPVPGIYLHRSSQGPDGPFQSYLIADPMPRLLLPRQPLALRHRRRWVMTGHAQLKGFDKEHPIVLLSDDDGVTWRLSVLPPVPPVGVSWPHAGPRWDNCGAEPTIAELADGRLYMLIRTSHDVFFESYSEDGGDVWTHPAPSRFYGTITTPLLFSLSDGRLLAFHNSSTPLPEFDHESQVGLDADERKGLWEDLFTNRDVIHAAISDDQGANWRGFRELHLNERRNDADFRSSGGNADSLDKSVHQCQAIELPEGKVMLAFGQHPGCRKIIRFDPKWLDEDGRSENFLSGLGGWSYHQYLKSVPGNFRGFAGHCALNRRPGAALIPHPDGEMREVLQVARHPDVRLLDEQAGAVWNFPAAFSGQLCIRLRLPTSSLGGRLSLVDRWFNPTDPVVDAFAQIVLKIDGSGAINGQPALVPDRWHDLVIRWKLGEEPQASLTVDGVAHALPKPKYSRNGLNYLHVQGATSGVDFHGLLIERVSMSKIADDVQSDV